MRVLIFLGNGRGELIPGVLLLTRGILDSPIDERVRVQSWNWTPPITKFIEVSERSRLFKLF